MDRNYEQVFRLILGPEGQCRGTTPRAGGQRDQVHKHRRSRS